MTCQIIIFIIKIIVVGFVGVIFFVFLHNIILRNRIYRRKLSKNDNFLKQIDIANITEEEMQEIYPDYDNLNQKQKERLWNENVSRIIGNYKKHLKSK